MKINKSTDMILVVDYQRDFITGSLAVTGAEELLPVINRYMEKFTKRVCSRDYHKKAHPSFIAQGGPWPDHCVADTVGSEIHAGIEAFYMTAKKGYEEEAYSAFESTGLKSLLKSMEIKRLFICGLATDYCVKATVIDALKEFDGRVYLLTDAIAAVDRKPNDGAKALEYMKEAGAIFTTF